MKKFLTVILAALVLTCGAACGPEKSTGGLSTAETSSSTRGPVGGNDSSADEESEEESEVVSSEDESEVVSSEDESEVESKSSKMYASLEEYLSADEVVETLELMQEQYADAMILDVMAEDNKLVYQYKYTMQMSDAALEDMEQTFEIMMDGVSSTNAQILEEINKYVDVENPVIVYRYLNADGTLIYEYEFDENTEVSSGSVDDFLSVESVEDYINLDSVQASIESMREQYASTADIDVTAESNKLIYSFTFLSQIDDSTASAFAEQCDSQVDTFSETYGYIAETLNTILGKDDSIVAVRYYNADGSLLWEKEFTAE